jgi:hypothetical protein
MPAERLEQLTEVAIFDDLVVAEHLDPGNCCIGLRPCGLSNRLHSARVWRTTLGLATLPFDNLRPDLIRPVRADTEADPPR